MILHNKMSNKRFIIQHAKYASGVKPTKVRLMRGRNESTRAVAMANNYCFAFNCTNKKQKYMKNTWNWQMLDFFHSFRTAQISIVPWECQNESGVCNPPRRKGPCGPFDGHSHLLHLQWPLKTKVNETPDQ